MGFFKNLFETKEKTNQRSESLYSPVTGRAISLSEVEDEVFAQGIMGKGIGIRPAQGRVYAPIKGTVTNIFPTGHAVGIETSDGIEVLLHIGIDTVSLNGKGFNVVVKHGNQVDVGQLLVEFDCEEIKKAGLKDTVMMIVTNQGNYDEVQEVTKGNVQAGDELISLIYR